MYGLEAISQNNGWAIAVAGGLIVMSGLTILSLVISFLPHVVALLDKREEKKLEERQLQEQAQAEPQKQPQTVEPPFLDAGALAQTYEPLTVDLGQTFPLTDLHKACAENDLPHTHLSIRTLLQSGKLIPEGEGTFSWKK